MSKVLKILLFILVGYAAGVAIGMALVSLFSGNSHDLGQEAAMTSIFVTGPLGAVAGLIFGLVRRRA